MRVAIIISVVANLAVAAWAARFDPTTPYIPLVLIPPPMPVARDAAPEVAVAPVAIEIVWLGDEAPAATPTTGSNGPRASAHVSTGTVRGTEVTPAKPTHSDLMIMRKPGAKPLVGMSADFLERLMKNTKPIEIPDLPGARIENQIDLVRDRMHSHAHDPNYSIVDDLAELDGLREARKQVELKVQKDGTYEADKPTFHVKVARDGTIASIEDQHLDTQDKLAKRVGIDVYKTNKLKFLDRTRDQRYAIGKEYKHQVLKHSRDYMIASLQELWAGKTSLAARKQSLFELWDDCAETGDDDLVAGAADARQMVINWIQMKLVGADAYTADELVRLNAKRTSKAVFAPYE